MARKCKSEVSVLAKRGTQTTIGDGLEVGLHFGA